jgi:hypothetical protein
LFRQSKIVSLVEDTDKWQDSRFCLPSRGDLVVISGGTISTFHVSPLVEKFHVWKNVWYEEGTYFVVLNVMPHRTIIPSEKEAMWHVVHGSRDYLLNTSFVRWKLVK